MSSINLRMLFVAGLSVVAATGGLVAADVALGAVASSGLGATVVPTVRPAVARPGAPGLEFHLCDPSCVAQPSN